VNANTPVCHFIETRFDSTTGAALADATRASSVNWKSFSALFRVMSGSAV